MIPSSLYHHYNEAEWQQSVYVPAQQPPVGVCVLLNLHSHYYQPVTIEPDQLQNALHC